VVIIHEPPYLPDGYIFSEVDGAAPGAAAAIIAIK
jgi:hypothetical protein